MHTMRNALIFLASLSLASPVKANINPQSDGSDGALVSTPEMTIDLSKAFGLTTIGFSAYSGTAAFILALAGAHAESPSSWPGKGADVVPSTPTSSRQHRRRP